MKANRLLSLLLALVLLLACAVPVLADDGTLPYDGDKVTCMRADGKEMGKLAAGDGTTAAIDGDNVVIHYVPKDISDFVALHWGLIDDAELTRDVEAADGCFEITLPAAKCGTLVPVAPVKADGSTSGNQNYLAIPAADKLAAPAGSEETGEAPILIAPAPLTYDGDEVTFLKADGSAFGMLAPQEGTTAALEGDSVVIHLVPKSQKKVYVAIHWGLISDYTLTPDVEVNEDGTFDFRVSADQCGTLVPIAPVKADGGTSKEQYYLALPAKAKLAGPVALTVENTTKMFKADSASYAGGKLTVALTGSTYKFLYKGTYEEAAANGDARENWIAGAENADGKLEFVIPVAEGETVVPVVSISQTYLDKYAAGENALERAFYPRQFVLDLDAGTLTVGDYEKTQALEVVVYAKMFKVEAASLETVGGPNSNNYKANLVITMGSDSFDKAFVGRAGAAEAEGAELVELSADRTFTLPVKYVAQFGKPETLVSKLDDGFIVSFHSAKKNAWYERQFRVHEDAGALDIFDGINAVATNQKLTVDGAEKATEIYNIDGSNYFKLRDIAALLTGTDAQFDVGYDAENRVVLVTRGQAYTPVEGDLLLGKDKSETTMPGTMAIQIDGALVEFESVYNIGDNNFFKLRELGEKLGFGVDYDEATRTMLVTSK